jgi:hypothetical protein
MIRACGLDLESASWNNDCASFERAVDCHSFNLHAQELQSGMASVDGGQCLTDTLVPMLRVGMPYSTLRVVF